MVVDSPIERRLISLWFISDLDEVSKGPSANGEASGVDGQNSEGEGKEKEEEEAQEDLSVFLRKEGEAVLSYAGRIFDKVYRADIERLVGMNVRACCYSKPPSPCRIERQVPHTFLIDMTCRGGHI